MKLSNLLPSYIKLILSKCCCEARHFKNCFYNGAKISPQKKFDMTRTMTVDLGNELRHYVESLVKSGDYKSNSEVLRESLGLLREKQAESKLEQLRHLIDEGEASSDLMTWNAHEFLEQMKKKAHAE